MIRGFLGLLLLWASAVLAQDAGVRKLSFEFNGTLSEAVRQLSADGKLNVVVQGNLDRPAQIYLHDVTAEEALSTVAKMNGLELTQEGSVWTLRSSNDLSADRPERVSVRMGKKSRNQPDRVNTGNVHILEGESVENAVAYGGTLRIDGHVEGDAVAFGGNIELGPKAEVEGDVASFGGKITVAEGARIDGDQTSFGSAGMASTLGQVFTQLPMTTQHLRADFDDSDSGPSIADFLVRFALFFGLGFLLWWILPTPMREIEAELRRDPFRCGLIGFVGAVALVPSTLLLLLSVIGIPVVPLLWGAVALAVLMGSVAMAHAFGLRIPNIAQGKTQAVVLAVGVLILTVVGLIPYLGPLAICVIGMLGLGAVIRTRFGTKKSPPPAAPPPAEALAA
jgi:hypothetical protein